MRDGIGEGPAGTRPASRLDDGHSTQNTRLSVLTMALKKVEFRNTNRSLDVVLFWRKEGPKEGLLLNPPYQRGDVWGRTRRRNLIARC